jgi:hypothetical protein
MRGNCRRRFAAAAQNKRTAMMVLNVVLADAMQRLEIALSLEPKPGKRSTAGGGGGGARRTSMTSRCAPGGIEGSVARRIDRAARRGGHGRIAAAEFLSARHDRVATCGRRENSQEPDRRSPGALEAHVAGLVTHPRDAAADAVSVRAQTTATRR